MAVFTKLEPRAVHKNTNFDKLDEIHSVMILYFDNFTLICAIAPSAGPGLDDLQGKLDWFEEFIELVRFFREIDDEKPLVIAGNFQTEIDSSDSNHTRLQPGFTHEETKIMSDLLSLNLVDTFRQFHPEDRKGFTYFTNYINKGHLQEHGSRFDYFLVSNELKENVVNSLVRSDIVDFTHSPITLFLVK